MKRTLAVLMIMMLSLSLFACGDKLSGNETEPQHYENDVKFQLGEVSGDTYENKFFGIKCKIGSTWKFQTEQELVELNGLATELTPDAEFFFDMFASAEKDYDYISVGVSKLKEHEINNFDRKKFYRDSIASIKEDFEDAGYTNFEYEITEITVDDKEYDALCITAQVDVIKVYQQEIGFIKNGYHVSILASAYNVDTCDEIFGFVTIE